MSTKLPDQHRWRFFAEPHQLLAQKVIFSEDESRLAVVLRLRVNDEIEVTDGHGTLAICAVESIGKKNLTGNVLSVSKRKRDGEEEKTRHLHLYIGRSKSSAIEESIESATQLGANAITIYRSEKSKDKQSLKPCRLNKISVESARISKSVHFTQISADNDYSLQNALDSAFNADLIFICDESPLHEGKDEHVQLAKILAETAEEMSVSLFIGPEGGFGPSDRNLFLDFMERHSSKNGGKNKAFFVSLGERILTVPNAVRASVALCRLIKWKKGSDGALKET